jgi:hypothetical protein
MGELGFKIFVNFAVCFSLTEFHTAKKQYRKFKTNNPRKGIARPQVAISTFMCL